MAKDFVKLSEVTVLEEVSDTASVLVEQNGEIYRAPKTQVGGAGGVKTAIIRDSKYLNANISICACNNVSMYAYCVKLLVRQ